MTGAITAGTIISAVGVAASIGEHIASGGSSSGGGASTGGGGGSGIQANEQKFFGSDASNSFYGVHVGTKPMDGEAVPKTPQMPINGGEVSKGRVATARETPTQAVGSQYAAKDYQGVWADRLSKYLDYNTRALG